METLLVVIAMAIGAFVKGVTGSGLPQLAIPAIATFAGVEEAVVVMAIPGVVTNSWLLASKWESRRETRDLPVLLVTGSIGAVAGTWLLESMNERVLAITLASMVLVYVLLFFLHPDFRLSAKATTIASPVVGSVAGVLQGATGISGPVVTTYLHAYRMNKDAYVFAVTTLFQVFAFVQLIVLLGLGLFTAERAVKGTLALIPVMIMLRLGAGFAKRLPRHLFDYAVLGVMILSASKLTYDALVG
jgi:uncharacterized membrane protein YfcA